MQSKHKGSKENQRPHFENECEDDPYMVNDSNKEPNESGESIIQSPFLNNKAQTAILANYNPTTRTYFKCSIYSPSNRLYTVDEVNSTFSAE